MEVRMYHPYDYPMILVWYKSQGENAPQIDMLPKNGFIVDDICAGFLYLTDSRLGIIDCYISNPDSPKDKRDKALNLVTIEIVNKAKEHGCRALMATTNIEAIKSRTLFHGFKHVCENSVYVKEI